MPKLIIEKQKPDSLPDLKAGNIYRRTKLGSDFTGSVYLALPVIETGNVELRDLDQLNQRWSTSGFGYGAKPGDWEDLGPLTIEVQS